MALSYNEILNSEVDPDSPITTSLMTRLRDNPIAIAQGAPHPDAPGGDFTPRVHIDKDPDFDPDDPNPANPNKQNAITTDQTNGSLVMVPDGLGSTEWEQVSSVAVASLFQVEGQFVIGTLQPSQVIVLPNEKVDKASDYNQPAGEFTAPIDGWYEFGIYGNVSASSNTFVSTNWNAYIQRDQGIGSWVPFDQLFSSWQVTSGNPFDPFAMINFKTVQYLSAGEKVRLYHSVSGGNAPQYLYGVEIPNGGAAVDWTPHSFGRATTFLSNLGGNKMIFNGRFISN
jgi:hypothetical protein